MAHANAVMAHATSPALANISLPPPPPQPAPPPVPRPPVLRLPTEVDIAWRMLETILRAVSLRSALSAWLWQEERELRKYLSHFGTISLGAVPTHLRQAAASVAWTDWPYAGTFDPTNRCYHAALRIVVGEPVPFELAVLNKESAGDLLEAVLGAELVLCQLNNLQGPAGARLRAARKQVEDAVADAMDAGHWG